MIIMSSRVNSLDAVDSFKPLLNQIEQDIINIFSDIRDAFAFLGLCYVARKTISVVTTLVDAFNVHYLGAFVKIIDWKEQFGSWAVVTGSSEGIGRAYAEELAKRGLNIVLISWDKAGLENAQSEIETSHGVMVQFIVADFASKNQTELYDNIMSQLGSKEIGLLVNNVGVMYDYPDVLLNLSHSKLWELIYVNIGAATMMTHLLLPQMVERGRGGVVVMGAGSSTQIMPQMTVYSATKRYLDYFLQGIAYEYRNSGVVFQCLSPFYVSTKMNSYSETLSKSGVFIPTAARYANQAVNTLGQSLHTTGYFPHTIMLWIAHSLPLSVWMWGSNMFNSSLRQQALRRHLKSKKSFSGDQMLTS